MKKTLFIVGIISLLITPVAYASFDNDLSYGSQGNEVIELQEFLFTNGYLTVNPTGNYYSLTVNAVKKFQKDNDISQTGYFGPITRSAVNNLLIGYNVPKEEKLSSKGQIEGIQREIERLTTQLLQLQALDEQFYTGGTVSTGTEPVPTQENNGIISNDNKVVEQPKQTMYKLVVNKTVDSEGVFVQLLIEKDGRLQDVKTNKFPNPVYDLNVQIGSENVVVSTNHNFQYNGKRYWGAELRKITDKSITEITVSNTDIQINEVITL